VDKDRAGLLDLIDFVFRLLTLELSRLWSTLHA
jgi:hypothetical protein